MRSPAVLRSRVRDYLARGPLLGWPSVLLWGSAVGVLAGLAEVGIAGIRAAQMGRFGFGDPMIWLSPLAGLVSFAAASALILMVAGRRRAGMNASVLAGILVTLAGYGIVRSAAPGILWPAALSLALGIGVFTARFVSESPARAAVPRAGLVLGGSLILLWPLCSAAVGGVHTTRAARRPPAPEQSPNVVLLILDTVRAASLGLYGNSEPTTPRLEAWARRGVVFDNAFATSPWTLPSHASMFTGRWHHELSVDFHQPLDDEHPTIAEYLSERGYATAGFVGNVGYASSEVGLGRGFDVYEDKPRNMRAAVQSFWLTNLVVNRIRHLLGHRRRLDRKRAADLNTSALEWLDGLARDRPFFLFINYFDAHTPYEPVEPFASRFVSESVDYWNFDYPVDTVVPAKIEPLRQAYRAAIGYVDEHVGRLLDQLERRGVLDNSIVIVASDHGEQFGEHGLILHSNSLFRPLLWVPLVIIAPGRAPTGVRVHEVVSIRDIPATIVDLVGGRRQHPFHGASLGRRWATPEDAPQQPAIVLAKLTPSRVDPGRRVAGRPPLDALIADDLYYIVAADGSERLFEVADRLESNDLSSDPDFEVRLEALRARLAALLDGAPTDALAEMN